MLSATDRVKSAFRSRFDVALTSLSRTRYALAVLYSRVPFGSGWLAAVNELVVCATSYATVYFLHKRKEQITRNPPLSI